MSEIRKQALSYTLSTLGRRRQTRFQLAQKLKARDYENEIIDETLDYCEEKKYINDEEFASFWVEDRIRMKPMGRSRLKQELRQKGVDDSIIEVTLEKLLPRERERVLVKELMMKQLEKTQGNQEPYKLFNFMVRRGFSRTQIYQGANELGYNFFEDNQT